MWPRIEVKAPMMVMLLLFRQPNCAAGWISRPATCGIVFLHHSNIKTSLNDVPMVAHLRGNPLYSVKER